MGYSPWSCEESGMTERLPPSHRSLTAPHRPFNSSEGLVPVAVQFLTRVSELLFALSLFVSSCPPEKKKKKERERTLLQSYGALSISCLRTGIVFLMVFC